MPLFISLRWLGRVPNNVEDLVAIGDEVDVKVIKIDEKGRIDASMKALLPRPPKPEHDEKRRKSLRDLTVHVITRTTKSKKEFTENTKRFRIRKGEMYGMVARNH